MKIGIAGSGKIVPDFLEAAACVKEIEPCAIFCTKRSLDKTEDLARRWNIPLVTTDFEELLQECEAVYVALPNHLHYEYSRKALEAGRSVICEKPFCQTARQLKELADLAEEKGLFLFEAISNQYFPNYRKVKELLPQIGPVRLALLNYSQKSSRYEDFENGIVHPVFDPEKNGGALADLNVYNIHFLTGLFGQPDSVTYRPQMERGVDVAGILILQYPGMTGSLAAAKNCDGASGIVLEGENGMIRSEDAANVFSSFTCQGREYALNERAERLYDELKAFSDMVRDRDFDRNREQIRHSIQVQDILDQARSQMQSQTETTPKAAGIRL